MRKQLSTSRRCCVVSLTGAMWLGCGGERGSPAVPLSSTTPVGLAGAIALHDEGLSRLLFVSSPGALQLTVAALPVGQGVIAMQASSDLERLFVLSRGVIPRTSEADEGPRLAVFSGAAGVDGSDRLLKEFVLDDPMERLAVDPRGEWVVAFGGDSTVVNPNELALLALGAGASTTGTAISKSIRSFGGTPVELLFTDALLTPVGGARRLLAVRTDRDVTLIDLEHLDRDEITIKLPAGASGGSAVPLQMVYHDGDTEDAGDARVAVRLADTADVVLLQLGPPEEANRDFSIVVNIVNVGGIPSWIDFVQTDGGVRLAALVPERAQAILVNPETTATTVVGLPSSFTQMRRIVSETADAPSGGDVALLWGAGKRIAFWSLGSTSAAAYRSVSTTDLAFEITDVLDVPAPNAHFKVLSGAGSDVFVLDLESRESFPLLATLQKSQVRVAPDGGRLWMHQAGASTFSAISLPELHPKALYVAPAVHGLFDIVRADGGRAVVTLHEATGWSATVLDAETPDSALTAYFPALQLRVEP